MWLKLSDSLYYFGTGGINRIESETIRNEVTQQLSEFKSVLYSGTTRVQIVKETVDEILEKLGENNE